MEVFDNKRTDWQGLWYQPDRCCYSSYAINLAALRKFKGNVRIILKKNKYYKKDTRRPNFVFMIADSKSDKAVEIAVENDEQDECKAYWVPSYYDCDALFCSSCTESIVFATCEQREHPYQYCPNCGARMDLDQEINTYTTQRYQRRHRTIL